MQLRTRLHVGEGRVVPKDKRSRDQKRKAKLTERAKKQHVTEVTPYEGRTYQADRWVPWVFETELAVHEAQVALGPRLTNEHVRRAFTDLVIRLRKGLAPTAGDDATELRLAEGAEPEFVITMIRSHWRRAFEERGAVAAADLIGILRTLLNSMEAHAWNRGPAGGHLAFLREFMRKQGVNVRKVRPAALAPPGDEPAQNAPPGEVP
jgi:hypothetical protein